MQSSSVKPTSEPVTDFHSETSGFSAAARRGTLDTSDGVVARFHRSPLRQHRSYHGNRRPDRARNSSRSSHGARSRQLKIHNQHLACCRRQSLHPQGSPRPDTEKEQAPKTVAENAKSGSQSRVQPNGETNQGSIGRIP
ncbi:hypothetical protein Trydic_g16452 [Trypoxylus dichotomus]